METFFTYAGQVITGILAFIALWKDAADYGELSKKWGRSIVGSLTFLLLALFAASIYLTYVGRKQAVQDKVDAKIAAQVSQAQNETLSKQILQMSNDRAVAEAGFRESFSQLSQKVANLQTKASTLELSKQLKETKEELRQAEAKLDQPKANVTPSLWAKQESEIPVQTTIVKLVDNAVTIDFFAFNKSDTSATAGSIFIRICDACRYAKEPRGFTTIKGADRDREHNFDQIYPHAGIEKFSAEVVPPEGAATFEFDVGVACQTCTPISMQHFFISVLR